MLTVSWHVPIENHGTVHNISQQETQ